MWRKQHRAYLAFLGESGQRRELCKPHPILKELEGGFEALPWPRGGSSPPEIQSASQLGAAFLQAAPKGPNRALASQHLHQGASNPAHFPLSQQIAAVTAGNIREAVGWQVVHPVQK